MDGTVASVGRSAGHTFGKPAEDGIRLVAVLDRDEAGNLVRKAGIKVVLPAGPYLPLEKA